MKQISNTSANSGNGIIKITCNTAVQFYTRERIYTEGQVGTKDLWEKFMSYVGDNKIETFWCDWIGSFGSQQVQAMSMGVYDLCTVRMDYHPELYELLRRKQVLVIKNAAADAVDYGVPVKNHPDVYTLWSAADDIRNMHKIMEFKVRRWEGK